VGGTGATEVWIRCIDDAGAVGVEARHSHVNRDGNLGGRANKQI